MQLAAARAKQPAKQNKTQMGDMRNFLPSSSLLSYQFVSCLPTLILMFNWRWSTQQHMRLRLGSPRFPTLSRLLTHSPCSMLCEMCTADLCLRFLSSLLFLPVSLSPLSLFDRGPMFLRGSPYTAAECGCRQAVRQNKNSPGNGAQQATFPGPTDQTWRLACDTTGCSLNDGYSCHDYPGGVPRKMSHGSAAFFGR